MTKMVIVMVQETIGELIKRLRQERGLSQRKLAKFADMDVSYISQLEGGRTASITLRTARALAQGLGVPPETFFQAAGTETPHLVAHSPDKTLEELEVLIKAYIPVYAEVSAGR